MAPTSRSTTPATGQRATQRIEATLSDVHSGADSPHVRGTPVEFWRGEWELKARENERLWLALLIQPFVILLLFLVVAFV